MIMGFASGSEKELGMHQIEACIVEHGSVQEAVASAPIAQEERPRVLCSVGSGVMHAAAKFDKTRSE